MVSEVELEEPLTPIVPDPALEGTLT